MANPISAVRAAARAAEADAGIQGFNIGGKIQSLTRANMDALLRGQLDLASGVDSPFARAYVARFYDSERLARLAEGKEASPGLLVEDAARAQRAATTANARAREKMPWLPKTDFWTRDYVPLSGEYVQDTNLNLIEALGEAQGRGLWQNLPEGDIRSELGHLKALASGGPHRGQWSRFGPPTVAAMRADVNATMGILDALAYQKLFEQRLLSLGKARSSSRAAELAGDLTMLSSTPSVKQRIGTLRSIKRAGSRGGSR